MTCDGIAKSSQRITAALKTAIRDLPVFLPNGMIVQSELAMRV
jgi:hypothetical protein